MEDPAPLHGDLARRVVVAAAALDWEPSPAPKVLRRRLHRVGPAESGQVTALVRYDPGASFPAHDHPEGEEILVLEGVFSDEHGDWPAGAYLLHPEGFRHAPFSRGGCVLFVKLRQYAGAERRHVAVDTRALPWRRTAAPGVEEKLLYADARFPDATRLERFAPGAGPVPRSQPDGAELLVLEGALEDDRGRYEPLTWLRLPPGAAHAPRSRDGCVLYVKAGGVRGLRAGAPPAHPPGAR